MVLANKYFTYVRRQTEGVGPVAWEGDTIKVAFLAAAHTPNLDTHEFWSNVNSDEISAGGGYVAGGATLSGKGVSVSVPFVRLTAADVEYLESTISAGYAVVYKDTGTASTSPLLGLVDFQGEQSSDNGRFAVEWDTGIVIEHERL